MFLVIEGIDGAGGSTQSNLLRKFLEEKNFKIELIGYPDYSNPIGRVVRKFLDKKFEISPEAQFLLYGLDMVKDGEKILKNLKEGKIVLVDRYIFSTLAYQCFGKKFSLKKGLKLIEIFELQKPDLVILLDIKPETSIKRKMKENKRLDRHEEDLELLKKVRKGYLKLAKENVFSKEWIVLDGEKEIEEVSEEIKKIVDKRLGE
ncbi:MAG: dTMP kinase [Candidatus Aenigmatarchaeota archaeon]